MLRLSSARSIVIASLMLLAPAHGALAGSQISPMFTYQGVLKSSGAPYNGTADLRFTLFDAAVGGTAVGSPIAVNAVQVTDGLFKTELYVDTPTINGDERWLGIEVRTPSNGGAGPYTALSGRQHLTPVPHAIHAINALHVSGQQDGVVWFNNESNAFNGSSLAIDNNTLRVDPVNHRVGVGTDTPMASLHIRNGSSGIAQPDPDSTLVLENVWTNHLSMLTSAGYESGILFGHAGAANQQATAGMLFNGPFSENGLEFRTGGNQTRMVINNAGNVGIGTVSPFDVLTVAGPGTAITALDGSVETRFFSSAATGMGYVGTNTGHSFILRTNDQDRVYIDVNGNVGIATQAPAQTLSVGGTAGKPGGGSWSTFSDQRLKSDVHDLDGALDSLLALRGVTFQYKDPAAINELPGEHIGMIAQEVEAVFPQWVSQQTPDGYKQLAFSGFEALTVEALRDLRSEKDAEIAQLRQQVAQLEALVQKLLDKEDDR